ncbi:hypothetical protein GOBAR_DD01274 [Gossypium barbadense]|nr:hypothetical protein GOBAR_DD01274 [Gossypium barbadense]
MELIDDGDVETMVVLYCGNRSDQNSPFLLFAELAGVEPTEDLKPLGEEHGAQETYIDVIGDDGDDSNDPYDHEVNSDSDSDVDEIRRTVIHNNPGAHMSLIDPDVAHAIEFLEYLKILPAHRLTVDSYSEEFQMEMGHVFVEDVKDAMVANRWMARLMTIKCTLRIWENEFPILPDLSTWEVPPTIFELVPDKGLRRNLKGGGVQNMKEKLYARTPSMNLSRDEWSTAVDTSREDLSNAVDMGLEECCTAMVRDILDATKLPEYLITMIPLDCLEFDNGCVNAPQV